MKRLFIIDNQAVTREGMMAIAQRMGCFDDIKVIEVTNLVAILKAYPDSVIVIDYTLIDISADRLLVLQERFSKSRFILFSDNLSDEFIRRMVYSDGAFSVVMKDSSLFEIENSLQKAVEGEQYVCKRVKAQLEQNSGNDETDDEFVSPLTQTEREILKLVALGKTTKEIASERNLSVYTVMTHRKNIFRKIEVNNVHEATKYALRAGIIDSVEYYI